LDSFIQVEENEWKAFLDELSQFEKKYKLLLNKLDMDESRRQASATAEQKGAQSVDALEQVPLKSSERPQTGQVRAGFLSQLKTKLESAGESLTAVSVRPTLLSKPQAFASCSRCGFQIVQPTRFCQRCGADFGKLLCSCGRELVLGDKFCDRCGRAL